MSQLSKHPLMKEYSLSPDWDNNWRFGGNLTEVIDESHLSSEWQMKAIQQFCKSKKERFEKLQNMLPSFDEESAEV